ncbi:hypothetical protein HDV01_000045 [Terramyces sp. JEL0728]|nr:hypothetical protein HDV01_000045 [Terramyces sp. JEL0728]
MAALVDIKERKDRGNESSAELEPPPLHKQASAIKIKNNKIQFGVHNRTAMGEYKSTDPDSHPLSHLAIPGPGPLDYDPKLPPSGFQYSILGKHQGPEQIEKGPGPNQYSIDKNKLVFDSAPLWTFGKKIVSKTEGDYPEITPGPLDYKIPNVLPDAPKGPAFTIRHKYDQAFYKGNGVPGPDVYYPKLDKCEKKVSLKGMSKEPKIVLTPGPANYIIPSSIDGPKCTMTARNIPYQGCLAINPDEEYVGPNPGPTDYNPSIKLTADSAPKFSLRSRLKERPGDNQFVPGPCAYNPKDRQIKYNQAPHVLLKGLPIMYTKREKMPGPADYGPDLNKELTAAELNRNTIKLSTAGKHN